MVFGSNNNNCHLYLILYTQFFNFATKLRRIYSQLHEHGHPNYKDEQLKIFPLRNQSSKSKIFIEEVWFIQFNF